MTDTVDTSAEAVERVARIIAERCNPHHAAVLRQVLRERDEARADAARYLADANKGAVTLLRPDIAAILRGDAVAVPVEATNEMINAGGEAIGEAWRESDWEESKEMAEGLDPLGIYRAMIAASPYAPKET